VRAAHLADLVYPAARAIYLFVELIVCVRFNEVDFYQNTLVLAGLAVVQATNLSAWMDALVNESEVFSSELNATYELSRCFNDTAVSPHVVQCFHRSTGEFHLLVSASPYLYPFIVEYLMLVMECVADWFFSDARRHRHRSTTLRSAASSRHEERRHGTPSSRQREHGQAADATTGDPADPGGIQPLQPHFSGTSDGADGGGGIQLQSVASFDDQQQPLHEAGGPAESPSSSPESVHQSGNDRQSESGRLIVDPEQSALGEASAAVASLPSLSDSAIDDRRSDREQLLEDSEPQCPPIWWCRCLGLDRCPPVLFSVIMPLIASFLFVIFGIYNFSLGQVGYRDVFICYRIGYWLSLSLAALVGYAVSRQFPCAPMNPNGFEYFVILSCVGPVLQSIFTIVANVQGDAVPMGIFLTEEITNIVHICVQVVFYVSKKLLL